MTTEAVQQVLLTDNVRPKDYNFFAKNRTYQRARRRSHWLLRQTPWAIHARAPKK